MILNFLMHKYMEFLKRKRMINIGKCDIFILFEKAVYLDSNSQINEQSNLNSVFQSKIKWRVSFASFSLLIKNSDVEVFSLP